MKALLIADSDTAARTISGFITSYGFDIIRYRSALKAIENIEEIAPNAIFISTGDFPRHWKTIVQYVRSDTDKDTTIVILLINERFTADDANKAVHIGVQAIISETLTASNDEHQLLELFSRYKSVGSGTHAYVYNNISERSIFLFTNPLNDTIITGKVDSLSTTEIKFRPDAPSVTAELSCGEVIENCSLKIGDTIISLQCRIKKNGNLMVLEFEKMNEKDSKSLRAFISSAQQGQ